MIYLKRIPILLRIPIALLLLCAFFYACTHDSRKSQPTGNKILEFIDKTRKENIPTLEKLRIYDSLHVVIKKQKDDTLKRRKLTRLSKAYEESREFEVSYIIKKEVEDLAIRIQDSLSLGHAYYNIGRYYAITDKIDSAYMYFYKSSKIYTGLGNHEDIGHANLSMAIMQKTARDYIGAESNTIKAIHYLEKVKDIRYLASSYNNLGTVSKELGNYEDAIVEFKKTFELRKRLNQNTSINAGTLNNIGSVYEYQGEYLKAINYYKQGLGYDSLLYKRPKTYVRLLDNLIYAQFLSEERKNFPILYRRVIQISDSIKEFKVRASSSIHLAEYYARRDKLDSANYYAKEALHISKDIPYRRIVLESLLLLIEINGPEEALEYSKEYIRITDSLQKVEKRFQDQFARIRFGTEELEQENIKVSKQRTWLFNVVIGMTVLGVLGYVVYYQRKLKYQYKASNLEQRLLRSQLNPHFLFNALNSVSGLVQKKSDQTIPYISKLGALLRSILENSREEFISLEEELDTIATYLELQSNFSKKFTFEIQIDENLHKEELLIPPMFLQPFIENAIDHGFKGNEDEKIIITVVQKSKDQVLYFSIEDNGIGYSNTMKNKKRAFGHQSLSGTILKERLALYARTFKRKARYVIEDVDTGEGTRVHLYLPYQLDV